MTAKLVSTAPLAGRVTAPSSKSQAHRLMICAAPGGRTVSIDCNNTCADITATADCLSALGAMTTVFPDGAIRVFPLERPDPEKLCVLPCRESGSTLRFMLPFAAAVGATAEFRMEGRLPERPIAPLDRELTAHGITLKREGGSLFCSGQLKSGEYRLPGNVSSQYISGLLMALPMLEGDSRLRIEGKLESAPYVEMTVDVLAKAGVAIEWDRETNDFYVPGSSSYRLPEKIKAEGDWSAAAIMLCGGALSAKEVRIEGLSLASVQGDRGVFYLLGRMGALMSDTDGCVGASCLELKPIDADMSDLPDVVPPLAVVAAVCPGRSVFRNIGRLRLKESDRIAAVADMINALGGRAQATDDSLIIDGVEMLAGGTVRTRNDHRIAMSGAIAASVSRRAVAVDDMFCVHKSYPNFWDHLELLKKGERR